MLLLLLQTFGPVLASPGQRIWMKICSEGGAVRVEADLERDAEDPTANYPECADCALCAVTSVAPVPDLLETMQTGIVRLVRCENVTSFVLYNSNWLWPEARGPPRRPEIRTERALRATMVSTELTGGAPWS